MRGYLRFSGSQDPGYIPRSELPRFPSSHRTVRRISSPGIDTRRQELQSYLSRLVDHPQALSNTRILSFLGAIHEIKSNRVASRKKERNAISISNANSLLDLGDIVLFRSNAMTSKLQRLATGSEFDHVVNLLAVC